ncbi:sucrase/ferredoxin domain-containing protein [Xylariales sp. AK1849]|nr:sucrase/ferredoxin domain-containing protein [Xylariales sp. AK1849]
MSQPRSTARTVFHIVYNAVYVLLCLLLAALVLITPGDAIRQAYFDTHQYSNIVITAIAYLVTVLIVLFVYSLRLYVTRTVLAGIPKGWIPVGKGDVGKGVREMVSKELGRSAAIAWEARPKVHAPAENIGSGLAIVVEEEGNEFGQEIDLDEEKPRRTSSGWRRLKKAATAESEMGIALPPTRPVWGEIEHPGWGSPNSPDLPNIQYSAVLAELPNLVEGKAISVAPPDPDSSGDAPALDPEAVALLQRSPNMSMRTYVGHLANLGILQPSKNIAEFLDTYDRARFSTRPMSVTVFRRLMYLFAELLRSTQALDRSVIDAMHDLDGMYSDSEGNNMDIDDDAPQASSPTTPARSLHSLRSLQSDHSPSARSGSSSHSHRLQAQKRRRPKLVARNSSGNTWGQQQYGTAPTTPKSKGGRSTTMNSMTRNRGARSVSSSGESANTFAQSRPPFEVGSSLGSGSSERSSLRSVSQGSEGSGGSVIRLARHGDGGDLPYVLRVGDVS